MTACRHRGADGRAGHGLHGADRGHPGAQDGAVQVRLMAACWWITIVLVACLCVFLCLSLFVCVFVCEYLCVCSFFFVFKNFYVHL